MSKKKKYIKKNVKINEHSINFREKNKKEENEKIRKELWKMKEWKKKERLNNWGKDGKKVCFVVELVAYSASERHR